MAKNTRFGDTSLLLSLFSIIFLKIYFFTSLQNSLTPILSAICLHKVCLAAIEKAVTRWGAAGLPILGSAYC